MRYIKSFFMLFSGLCILTLVAAAGSDTTKINKTSGVADEGGLTLPGSFTSVKFATGLGRARHLVVAANGDVFVKLDKLKDGKGILRLRDTNGDGKADNTTGFGKFTGTGIKIKNGYLYASDNSGVYRFKLDEKTGNLDEASVQRIVTGLWDRHQHEAKAFTLDNNGNLYVNIGAPSNCCQVQDRTKGSLSHTGFGRRHLAIQGR
jgi:glucose/arabinose dehydrogenase